MALKVHKFVRKPLYVDAVRITKENMAEVAEWCGGKLAVTTVDGESFDIIKVRVPRPLSARQTMGFPGDWVLKAKNSFKIYTPRAFDKQFEKVRGTLTKKQADEAGIRPPIETAETQVPCECPAHEYVGRECNCTCEHSASIVEVNRPKAIRNAEIISASIVKDGSHPITIVEDNRIQSRPVTPAELEKLAKRHSKR